ncbi:hypothetical protein HDU76_012060, partial [Blyttiomyces sp. JEL0837]
MGTADDYSVYANTSPQAAAAVAAVQNHVQQTAGPPAYENVPTILLPEVCHAVIDDKDVVLVKIKPAEGIAAGDRAPVDVVCIVDVSGSMDDPAIISSSTPQETTGLTVLDI